jgi:Tfp pilus assembly protein PilF
MKLMCFLLLLSAVFAFADQKKARENLTKAEREAAVGNLTKAEKLLRDAVQQDPSYLKAHTRLADVLFQMRKFGAASDEYAAALKINDTQKQLGEDEVRQVTDQLGVSTAMGGNLPKAKNIFEEAIQRDPDYALFRYNLACTYAEMGDLDTAILHLQEAWKRRRSLAEGERFPDPRQDSSFKRYLDDPRFQEAVREMVF